MFDMNKEKFGAFVSALRKEKGMTQKELAAALFISDKAVSKWETGQSLPDVSLLIPLADIFGVTVTELLQGERIANTQSMPAEDVESLVKKAVTLAEETEGRRKANTRFRPLYITAVVFSAMQIAGLYYLLPADSVVIQNVTLLCVMAAAFGVYLFFFVKEKLPAYYDSNKIGFYADRGFKINIPGVSFNNSNWPYVVKALRYWVIITSTTAPLVAVGCLIFIYDVMKMVSFPLPMPFRNVNNWEFAVSMLLLALYLGGMLAAIYFPAKKYE